MLKILKRLLALSVALAITLSLGIVVSAEEVTYPLAADGVMTSVPVTSDNLGHYSPKDNESITLNSTSYTSGVTANSDGTITYANIEQVSFKLPDTYSAGETIYVHVTGTVGNDQIRMFLVNSSGGTSSTNYYSTATDGSFEYLGEMIVDFDCTASEINFKGDSYGVVITSLTVTSIEVFEGSAAEYKTAYCVKNGHTYENGVCAACGDSCTDILAESGLSSTYGDVTVNLNGSFTVNETSWFAIKLDKTYGIGETVKVHITGTSDTGLGFYLSESDQSGNITDNQYYSSISGDFDETITFTVGEGTTITSTQTQAVYLTIKPTSGNFSNFTITHLGVVQYGVTVAETANGSVTADKTRAGEGETVTLTVTPSESFSLASLTVIDASGDDVTVNADYTFTMPASNVTVTATFADTCETTIAMGSSSLKSGYSSSVTVNEGVSINSSAEQFELSLPYEVSVGETVIVHITGTSDANFRIWLGDGSDDRSNQVNATDDLGYSGSGDFDLTFTLTVNQDELDAGYIMFKGYKYGENLVNLTLTHVGISSAYTITVSECENGSVTADLTAAAAGETVTLTASPVEGYEFSEWNVTYGDNVAVTVADDGTFTMPAGNVTVSATFVEKAAPEEGDLLFDGNITFSSNGSATLANGTLTVADGTEWIAVKLDQTYAIGETVTIHIAGSSSTKLRWYLSESNSGAGNITTPVYFFEDSSGNFDVTYSFTVEEGLTGSEANYLFIKAPSGSVLSGLTITTLEVVANPATGGGSLVSTSSVDGVIYVNENYHGYLVTENGRTHILSAPHNVDANGYCTVCHGYVGTTEEEEEVTVDITEEEVEIIDAQEPGDTDDEDSADSEDEPEETVEANPTTGAMIALIPIAIAGLAAISSKKK
ncbi:MAG: hypothetical protein LIO72_02090 [Ruminococcus sp.]|nr:hypothetical protein [Ruminococcus sp.]